MTPTPQPQPSAETRARGRKLLHGEARRGKLSPEFNAWRGIIGRCTSSTHADYAGYGGRGIKVCHRWLISFQDFLEDVGRKPSAGHQIGRINNDGDYEPSNVRWETAKEQANNRRSSVLLTYLGETKSAQQWADQYGLTKFQLRDRLKRGWSLERSLLTAVKQYAPRI